MGGGGGDRGSMTDGGGGLQLGDGGRRVLQLSGFNGWVMMGGVFWMGE